MREMRQHRLCKNILMNLEHLAPPILYYEAPMTYMTENRAQKFYEGVPPPEDQIKELNDLADTQTHKVINYCVV